MILTTNTVPVRFYREWTVFDADGKLWSYRIHSDQNGTLSLQRRADWESAPPNAEMLLARCAELENEPTNRASASIYGQTTPH